MGQSKTFISRFNPMVKKLDPCAFIWTTQLLPRSPLTLLCTSLSPSKHQRHSSNKEEAPAPSRLPIFLAAGQRTSLRPISLLLKNPLFSNQPVQILFPEKWFWALRSLAPFRSSNPVGESKGWMSMDQFEVYFRRADLDHDGRISGAEAVNFFRRSGLDKQVLAQVSFFPDSFPFLSQSSISLPLISQLSPIRRNRRIWPLLLFDIWSNSVFNWFWWHVFLFLLVSVSSLLLCD